MKRQAGFQLKHSRGWFAAGREVAWALELLSDATFKLFVWLCLHAERSRGVVSATSVELARALGKNETAIQAALEELQRQGVCVLQADGVIQIGDRFWPYQRRCDPSAGDEARSYVEAVKRMFFERRCVQSSFTAADENLALALYARGVPLIHVEHAILLGAARKYASLLEHGQGTAISSLHYFSQLLVEVQQVMSPHYWTYITRKVKTFEQTWAGFSARGQQTNQHVAKRQTGGYYGSTESATGLPSPS
jgi:hypothetical protein